MAEIHDFSKVDVDGAGPIVERWHAGNVETLRYESGEVRVRCVVSDFGDEIVIAALGIQHTVTWEPGQPPTISPSLLVEGAGGREPYGIHIHGFLTDGVWHPCGDDRSVPLPEET